MNGSRTFAVILVILALVGLAAFAAYRYNDRGAVTGTSYGSAGSELRNDTHDFGKDVEDKAKDTRDAVDGKDAGDHIKDWGRNAEDAVRDAGDKVEGK